MAGGPRSSWLSHGRPATSNPAHQGRLVSPSIVLAVVVGVAALSTSCAKKGYLSFVEPVAPKPIESPADSARAFREEARVALFGDTLIGFQLGTADSTKRFLGRLRDGYVADTLNIFLLGDNRPGFQSRKLRPQVKAIESIASLNPLNWAKGIVNIPILLWRGTFPDFMLWRELPSIIRNKPTWGREEQVVAAMLAAVDSLKARKQIVAAVINTGDLVKDGRYPEQWERFVDIVRPLAKQVPYFPIAGNHERTDSPLGLHNWRVATGLPVGGDRLYYCFESADGWVRFVALDSNPMTDPKNYWSREVEVKYSAEQIEWLKSCLNEHRGPAFIFLHHPPFSLGFHRAEWQNDAMLKRRRADLVKILRDARLSVVATGHEHAYERALLTCGDAVIIFLVTGGAGSPLHDDVPLGSAAAQMYAAYEVEGCGFQPKDVFASRVFHFIHLRLWFGGGEFRTYAVDDDGKTRLIDDVKIDLARYGTPKIDQFKIPIPPEEDKTQPPPTEEGPETEEKKEIAAKSDSVSASERLLSKPPPGKKAPKGKRKGTTFR